MANLNTVNLIGRLGRDADVFDKGANLALAVTESYKDKEGKKVDRTDWFRVTAFGKLGDFAKQYLKKGAEVLVTGSLRTGKYKGKDGVEHYTVDVIAERLQVIKWPADKKPSKQEPAAQPEQEEKLPAAMADADDIPF